MQPATIVSITNQQITDKFL